MEWKSHPVDLCLCASMLMYIHLFLFNLPCLWPQISAADVGSCSAAVSLTNANQEKCCTFLSTSASLVNAVVIKITFYSVPWRFIASLPQHRAHQKHWFPCPSLDHRGGKVNLDHIHASKFYSTKKSSSYCPGRKTWAVPLLRRVFTDQITNQRKNAISKSTPRLIILRWIAKWSKPNCWSYILDPWWPSMCWLGITFVGEAQKTLENLLAGHSSISST